MIWETAKPSMSLQCPKQTRLRGSDLAQGRWGESPSWHVGTCPFFWMWSLHLSWAALAGGWDYGEGQEEIHAQLGREREGQQWKGWNWKTATTATFPESFSIWQTIWVVCLKKCFLLPLLKNHLPFGQVLGLRSHTTFMWPLNLLRFFFLCFAFFAQGNVAGCKQHPQRAVEPAPFGPGLDKWNWAFLEMAIPDQKTVTKAENLSVLYSGDFASWHWFSRLKGAFNLKCWSNKKQRKDMGKKHRLGQECSGSFLV